MSFYLYTHYIAMMGRDQGALQNNGKAVDANVFLWDNNGVCRGRIPLNDYKTDRFYLLEMKWFILMILTILHS